MTADDRRWELDALRGLMLVLMTLTHLPTRFADPLGQPLGFVSAAEGFVFLSAYMAGQVYSRRALRRGMDEMAGAFRRRALKLYAVQAGLMIFLFSAIAGAGVMTRQEAVLNMLGFYFEEPLKAFVAGLVLLYNPPLLDILPMYIVLMILSPLVLLHGLRHGWAVLLLASLAVWLAAQFELGPGVRDIADALTGSRIPFHHTGAFDLFAWQFLWVAGLWFGAAHATGDPGVDARFPTWMVVVAWGWAIACFLWRHGVGQTPFPGVPDLNLLFDKWRLGPLRLLDFLALLLIVMRHGAWLRAHAPRWRVLETLGAASLPVFCTHLVATLVALTVVGAPTPERPWAVDVAVLVLAFVALWIVARATVWADRRAGTMRARVSG